MAQQPIVGPKLIVSSAITQADTNTTVNAVEIPAGAFVPPFGVSVYVAEAFAGGTPSLDVGDSDAADNWVDTTEITEATPAMYSGAAGNSAAGKYYASGDFIKVAVSASLTDGTAYVIVRFYDFADLSLAAA